MADQTSALQARPGQHDDLRRLLARGIAGEPSALPELRKRLEYSRLLECGGNLAAEHRQAVLDNTAGNDLPYKEAVERKLDQLREELTGNRSTPIEQLLVERIVSCWLSLLDAECRYTRAKNLNTAEAGHRQKFIDRAHGRFLSAVKALATVRKLIS